MWEAPRYVSNQFPGHQLPGLVQFCLNRSGSSWLDSLILANPPLVSGIGLLVLVAIRKRSKIKCNSGHKPPKGYSIPRELPV